MACDMVALEKHIWKSTAQWAEKRHVLLKLKHEQPPLGVVFGMEEGNEHI